MLITMQVVMAAVSLLREPAPSVADARLQEHEGLDTLLRLARSWRRDPEIASLLLCIQHAVQSQIEAASSAVSPSSAGGTRKPKTPLPLRWDVDTALLMVQQRAPALVKACGVLQDYLTMLQDNEPAIVRAWREFSDSLWRLTTSEQARVLHSFADYAKPYVKEMHTEGHIGAAGRNYLLTLADSKYFSDFPYSSPGASAAASRSPSPLQAQRRLDHQEKKQAPDRPSSARGVPSTAATSSNAVSADVVLLAAFAEVRECDVMCARVCVHVYVCSLRLLESSSRPRAVLSQYECTGDGEELFDTLLRLSKRWRRSKLTSSGARELLAVLDDMLGRSVDGWVASSLLFLPAVIVHCFCLSCPIQERAE